MENYTPGESKYSDWQCQICGYSLPPRTDDPGCAVRVRLFEFVDRVNVRLAHLAVADCFDLSLFVQNGLAIGSGDVIVQLQVSVNLCFEGAAKQASNCQ